MSGRSPPRPWPYRLGNGPRSCHGVITLNESGCILWKALEKGADIEQLTALLAEQYEVEPDQAKRDAENFLESLREQKVLL